MSNPSDFKRPIDWRRAFAAIQVMREDPNRTDQVFELNVALDGGDADRMFAEFLAEPGARALLDEAPSLLDQLADFDALLALPVDTLGGAYLRLMTGNGYTADGLRREAEKVAEFAELHPGPERSWFAARNNCVHDLLHVLTGYGQDPAGETVLLAFTDGLYSQHFRLRVIRFGLFASLLSAPKPSILRACAFAWRARRRGARARLSLSFDWEAALARPLDELRRELRVMRCEDAHPSGILRGPADAPWSYGPAVC